MPAFTPFNEICLTPPWLSCTLLTKSRLLTTAPQILCELTSDPLFNHTDILVHQTVCEIFYLQAFTHAVSSAWNSLPTWLSETAVFSSRKPSLISSDLPYSRLGQTRSVLLGPLDALGFPHPSPEHSGLSQSGYGSVSPLDCELPKGRVQSCLGHRWIPSISHRRTTRQALFRDSVVPRMG